MAVVWNMYVRRFIMYIGSSGCDAVLGKRWDATFASFLTLPYRSSMRHLRGITEYVLEGNIHHQSLKNSDQVFSSSTGPLQKMDHPPLKPNHFSSIL